MKRERTVVEFVDDLTGESIDETQAETVVFGWVVGGKLRWLEIDLSADNASKFQTAMQPYLNHGRERVTELTTTRDRARSARNRSKAEREEREKMLALRGWARENGYNIGDRGRIPQEIRDAFNREFPSDEAIAEARKRWAEF